VETIQEILSNANDDELAVLAEYYEVVFCGQRFKDRFDNLHSQQEKVTQIIRAIQRFAKSFFLSVMEYDQIAVNVAKMLDLDVAEDSLVDYTEIEIAKSFILNNYADIPAEQIQELANMFDCTGTEPILKEQINQALQTALSTLTKRLEFLEWLASTAFQTFLAKGSVWESNGFFAKIIYTFIFGGSGGFRMGLILPIIHISMLRHKQRYQTR
jgi:hypothetical protein